MRFSLWNVIVDIMCILRYRMKLILKDPITILVLGISAILFAVMVRSLAISAEDLSSLPIGLIDYDNSESSRELISGLKKVETLRLVEGTEKDLHKQLLDEMITSIFVIEKGYEDHLKSGDLKKMISMYYKEDNKSAPILADIVAGEIIYPAGLYKSYRYYDKLTFSGDKLSLEEYSEFMQKYIASTDDFNFAFQMIYENPVKAESPVKPVSNSILYNQFIIGILGIMIAFIAMFILSQTVSERENGVEERLKVTGFHILKKDIGNLLSLLIVETFLSLVFTGLIISQMKLSDPGIGLSVFLLMLLNSVVLSAIMLLLTKLIHRILPYQICGSAFILLSGGLGFYNLLSGFYKGFIHDLVKIIPNSWFIKGFTDIIVYGSGGGYLKDGHRILFIMAVVAIALMTAVDMAGGLYVRKRRTAY